MITKNKNPPEKSSLLVKSNKDLQDRPKEPVYTFTQGNVIGGEFAYETVSEKNVNLIEPPFVTYSTFCGLARITQKHTSIFKIT